MGAALDLQASVDELAGAVKAVGPEGAAVLLSEGFCVSCRTHSAPGPIFDEEDFEDTPKPEAIVWCAKCRTHWRTGTNPENGRPWIAHTQAKENMIMTMTVNAVSEPREEEEEDDWFE